ncbi:MAG: efflux RND transporter periplasmic adaptor subunit [Pseudomonadota bacterium]
MTFASPAIAIKTDLDCLIEPETYVELSSPIDTVIENILVKQGDTVTKGQELLLLESSVERVRVKLAEERAKSSSDVENRYIQLKYAKLNHQRTDNLYKKKSTSEFERDRSSTELALARVELNKARENKEIAQLNLELARAQLELKTIRSPIDGIVMDIYTTVGESVADRSIMKLAQINPLKVELIAPTEYFGLIQPGMKAIVRPERPVNKIFDATVVLVDQLIDSASGSFTVRLALPNPNDKLVGGVNCLASFDLDPRLPFGTLESPD